MQSEKVACSIQAVIKFLSIYVRAFRCVGWADFEKTIESMEVFKSLVHAARRGE